jgi:hypothetical protein
MPLLGPRAPSAVIQAPGPLPGTVPVASHEAAIAGEQPKLDRIPQKDVPLTSGRPGSNPTKRNETKPVAEVGRCIGSGEDAVQIPRLINKVIIMKDGGLPDINQSGPLTAAHRTWATLNPCYTVRYWGGGEARAFLNSTYGARHLRAFDTISAYSGKVNLLRLCLLYAQGG